MWQLFTLHDGVFGSLFFLLTGFHGIHVIIGAILDRALTNFFVCTKFFNKIIESVNFLLKKCFVFLFDINIKLTSMEHTLIFLSKFKQKIKKAFPSFLF